MKKTYIQIFAALVFAAISVNIAQDKKDYTVIEYSTEIEEGKDLDKDHLFDGEGRKITQITMRNGKSLGSHSVKMPIIIYCTAGDGELIFNNDNKITLSSGSFVTIDANISHDVLAKPDLSFLLIRIMGTENKK